MRNFTIIYLLGVLTVFGNGNLITPSTSTPIIEKANQQTEILESIVRAYIQLNSNPSEIREDIDNNRRLFVQNIEDLFLHAEDHGVEMIRLVGAQLNAWEEFHNALELPSTKENQDKVMSISKELVLKNDQILNVFKPTLIQSAFTEAPINF